MKKNDEKKIFIYVSLVVWFIGIGYIKFSHFLIKGVLGGPGTPCLVGGARSTLVTSPPLSR